MKMKLSDVAELLPGHPFRGKIAESANGNAHVIQLRDVDRSAGICWSSLQRVDASGRKRPVWLQGDDIIFVARGQSNYALWIEKAREGVVVSPVFYLIRIKAGIEVIPRFLAWQINQSPAQKYLQASSEGSVVVNIRKPALADMPIIVPSLEEQIKAVEMIECWEREKSVIDALAGNHQKLMAVIAEKIFNKASQGEGKSE